MRTKLSLGLTSSISKENILAYNSNLISLKNLRATFPKLNNYKDAGLIKILDEVNRDFDGVETITEEAVENSMLSVLAERGYAENNEIIDPELYRQRYIYNKPKGLGGPGVDPNNPVVYS